MSHERFSALADTGQKRKNSTKWYLELRREPDRLADLNYAIRDYVVQEALEVEDENGWKHLNVRLPARLTWDELASAHWLELRDVCECVLNDVYRIGL